MTAGPDAAGMDGVLVVAKPAGPTSHDVVALVRRLAATRRVGHGGTLDPFASGVLPIFLGRATRLAEYHLGAGKRYRATICFGASSTTDDVAGELSPVDGPRLDQATVAAGLASMLGPQEQRPPAFSAVQIGGRRAYALAREGRPVELTPRRVILESLDMVEFDAADPARPMAIVDVACSAGTYVRALARDLGLRLGGAAYLGALVRTASGPFDLAGAIELETVRQAAAAGGPQALRALLLPVDAGLEYMPAVTVSATEADDLALGRFIRPAGGLGPAAATDAGVPIRVLGPGGRIVAIGTRQDRRIAPDKLLVAAGRAAATGPADG